MSTRKTRRQFLEDSMFAAAAAVAAASTRPIWADEPAQSSSPNERLRVAMVGVRGQGRVHLEAYINRKDVEVAYICDPDREVGRGQVEAVAKRQPTKPDYVDDLRKALDDKSVDLVSIATPNHWHALAAIWAIQSGKDVYVEKPVSHNVSEGRRIVQAARKHGRICQTGTQSRSNAGMIAAIEFVQGGGIGEVNLARGLCYKPRGSIGARGQYSVPDSINYDVWLGPAPVAPLTRPQLHYDWHWQWPYGNGDLGNQGIHQMDLARWGLGLKRLSNTVVSYGGRFGYEDAGDTPNTQVVMHDFGDKSLVFEVRGLTTDDLKGARVGVIFEGTGGYVVMTSDNSGAAFDPDGKMIKKFDGGGNHFANFIQAVRSRNASDLHADIEEGHLSSALCHTGNISYRLGAPLSVGETLERLHGVRTTDKAQATLERVVDHLKANKLDTDKTRIQLGALLAFDAAAETFMDSAEANAMLTREYRSPFVVPEASQV